MQCHRVGGPQGSTLPRCSPWHVLCTQMCGTGWAAPSVGHLAKPNPPPPSTHILGHPVQCCPSGCGGSPCRRLGAAAAPLQRSAARQGAGCNCDAAHIALHVLPRPSRAAIPRDGVAWQGHAEGRGVLSTCSMACASACVCVCVCTRASAMLAWDMQACVRVRTLTQVLVQCASTCVRVLAHRVCMHMGGGGSACAQAARACACKC